MKVSDYIVDFLIKKGGKIVFGYPGGMVTHLIDSFWQRKADISICLTYHEQGCAFAACGYAQATGEIGLSYATSGPGATNLITGICNAYFDSIPVLFLTGQVNSNETKGNRPIRQRGFQETDIISMVKNITNYSVYVENKDHIRYHLEKAYYKALTGRKGPVVLDIPMDIQRSNVEPDDLTGFQQPLNEELSFNTEFIINLLRQAERPCIIAGNGIRQGNAVEEFMAFIHKLHIPVVTSMIAVDIIEKANPLNYGFIGAYGDRTANFIIAKSDLIISLGSRLDIRQVGAIRHQFAPLAKIIRIDIDKGELAYKVHEDEIGIIANVKNLLQKLVIDIESLNKQYNKWLSVCNCIKNKLQYKDIETPNKLISKISQMLSNTPTILADVGQNQIWVAQSFFTKCGQRILFSGGLGAMGYSLPAAIGAYYATKQPVVCFAGDGGIQMNIQELQVLVREQLPITVIILNNKSLGMMRHFQELYFHSSYVATVKNTGYDTPNFQSLAKGYGLLYRKVKGLEDIHQDIFDIGAPQLLEVLLEEKTYAYPKLEFGKPNQDQEPLIERSLFEYLMKL